MARMATYHKPALGKVLLVEDEALYGSFVQKNLRRLNVDCDWVTGYEKATEALDDGGYHALVTDIYLDNLQPLGLRLISIAKEKGIASIVVTQSLDKQIAKRGLNQGADQVLEKPFEVKALVQSLIQIWENPRGLIGLRERFLDRHSYTKKEREIVRLILKGLNNAEIARLVGTSLSTVKYYSSQIFEKAGVKSRAELFNLVFPT